MIAVAAIAVALALAACTGTDAHRQSGSRHVQGSSAASGSGQPSPARPSNVPSAASVPEITSEAAMGAGYAYPLDAYSLTGIQFQLINQADYLLISQCMQGQGFTMPAYQSPPTDIPAENRLVIAFGVGILSEVEKYGYDEPPKYIGKPPPTDPPADATKPAFQNALLGPPADRPPVRPLSVAGHQLAGPTYTPSSCTGRAYAQLGVTDARQLSIGGGSAQVANIDSESRDRADSDPRVLAVTKSWSACMAKSGFTASTPLVATNTYGPKAKPLAIAAATADVKCKYQTNYFGIMYAVTAAYQTQFIDSGLTVLETLKNAHAKLLAKANAVIRSS